MTQDKDSAPRCEAGLTEAPTAGSTGAPAQSPRRRNLLGGGLAAAAVLLVPSVRATPEAMESAVQAFTAGGATSPHGIRLEIATLQESGNAVPVTVSVDSPMTDSAHVRAIAVFNERNPQPEVAVFHLSPHCGRARVSTRIRLGDSQRVVAVARMSDGRHLRADVDVVVTLPACVESS